MSKIRNTTVPDAVHEVSRLSMLVGTDAILAQEARGAAEMASQTAQLPAKGSNDPAWAKMGVLFGDAVSGDRLFRHVRLPAGWKIVRTNHSMWTNLVDERGRKRASICYKAAFYDRDAHISPVRRFSVTMDYVYPEKSKEAYPRATGKRAVVKDRDKVLHEGPILAQPPEDSRGFDWAAHDKESERLHAEAAAWLVAQGFPDWKDAAAYWD